MKMIKRVFWRWLYNYYCWRLVVWNQRLKYTQWRSSWIPRHPDGRALPDYQWQAERWDMRVEHAMALRAYYFKRLAVALSHA